MTTGKIKIDPYATGHPLHEGTSYIPVNFQKSNGQPGGHLKPHDTRSTRLQELSLMNNSFFGNIHYDIHLDMKLDYTISRIFQEMSLSELELLLPYYPKEYALRELTQLYSFTGLKVIQNHPHTENEINEQNDIHLEKQKKTNYKPKQYKKLDQKIPQKERKNTQMIEKIVPQEQIEKSEHRELSRLRNQPRKNYKTFIPQSKILKKVEFQKQL